MNAEVEENIRRNVSWTKLPTHIQQQLGNSQKEYEKSVLTFSVKNQVRYRGNLIRHIRKDEKKYYSDLILYSRQSLMLFPYHLADVIIKGLVVTPFQYYSVMLETLMAQEKSYDSLPNFTAADCLRLLGIGRNQYIDLMNQSRSSKKFGFFRKSGRDLLPSRPVDTVTILPWWMVQVGYITEEDMKAVDKAEHSLIDQLIDRGSCPSGHADYSVVFSLFRKGLVYFDVPIEEDDYVIVPPLEGFVMNRVLGDYFETLLYKIFVSIDENTTVAELASVLEIDVNLVRDAVSLYCRLGFAKKKNSELDCNDLHPSWYDHLNGSSVADGGGGGHGSSHLVTTVRGPNAAGTTASSEDEDDSLLRELNMALEANEEEDEDELDFEGIKSARSPDNASIDSATASLSSSATAGEKEVGNHKAAVVEKNSNKKIAFLFDSTLTAYLMMGNLSPGLKNHAVTMFEVGKLSDESLDSLVHELEKVSDADGEGEAARYFSHALTLRDTVLFLRQNPMLKSLATTGEEGTVSSSSNHGMCLGLDLIRCESLQSLDTNTASRLLKKNYSLLVSMAPLSNEIRPMTGFSPPHLGPAIPEISSIWFKLYLYHKTGSGPPSLLLAKGSRLRRLPKVFEDCNRLLVTSWGHDPSEIPVTGALTMLLDALQHSAILVQAICPGGENAAKTRTLPFPIDSATAAEVSDLSKLRSLIDIEHTCGYVTLLDLGLNTSAVTTTKPADNDVSDNKAVKVADSSQVGEEGGVGRENAKLLEEELDNIDHPMAGNKDRGGGGEGESDESREEKLGKLSLDLKKTVTTTRANWILLDLNFGIPLFDAELNRQICQRIVSKGLWKKESLDALTESSQSMCHNLIEFIAEFQDSAQSQQQRPQYLRVTSTNEQQQTDPRFPTRNLFFDGKSLEVWRRK